MTEANKVKLKNIDIEKVSAALEADAGHALAGILESLAEAKAASPPQTLTGNTTHAHHTH